MADANIYSLLLEEEPVAQVAKKVQPAAKPSTKPAAKPASRPTTQGKKDVVRNKKPAPFKEGQFEEKPEHKGESRGVRHHKYEKPAHGRAYDRKSGTHPVKGGDKKEVAGASWGDAVESQLAAPVEEGQEETYCFLT
jgi:hypothetical protein